jgi:hypothetical protein
MLKGMLFIGWGCYVNNTITVLIAGIFITLD